MTSVSTYLLIFSKFSYGSSSPILSDRKRFPRFFRLALPDQKLNPARIDLMKTFNWQRVATINQAMEFFSVVNDFCYTLFKNIGLNLNSFDYKTNHVHLIEKNSFLFI